MDLSILSNEVFGGVVGGSLVVSALYALRSVPAHIGHQRHLGAYEIQTQGVVPQTARHHGIKGIWAPTRSRPVRGHDEIPAAILLRARRVFLADAAQRGWVR